MSQESEQEFLQRVLLGHESAVVFTLALFQISQALDDLVDRDNDLSNDRVQRAFWQALVVLPCNTFYQQHFETLQPQIQLVFFDWLSANELERGSDHDRNMAFTLRDSLHALAVTAARLIGGYAHAKAVAPEIRRYFHDETLGTYKEGLA